jgi:hypothetical protein
MTNQNAKKKTGVEKFVKTDEQAEVKLLSNKEHKNKDAKRIKNARCWIQAPCRRRFWR